MSCFLSGQFYHGVEFELMDLLEVQGKLDATMYVKGQTLHVTRCTSSLNTHTHIEHAFIYLFFTYTVHTPHHWFSLFHRHRQKDFSRDVKNGENIFCWFVNNNGTGLMDGEASDYIVSDLFKTV